MKDAKLICVVIKNLPHLDISRVAESRTRRRVDYKHDYDLFASTIWNLATSISGFQLASFNVPIVSLLAKTRCPSYFCNTKCLKWECVVLIRHRVLVNLCVSACYAHIEISIYFSLYKYKLYKIRKYKLRDNFWNINLIARNFYKLFFFFFYNKSHRKRL